MPNIFSRTMLSKYSMHLGIYMLQLVMVYVNFIFISFKAWIHTITIRLAYLLETGMAWRKMYSYFYRVLPANEKEREKKRKCYCVLFECNKINEIKILSMERWRNKQKERKKENFSPHFIKSYGFSFNWLLVISGIDKHCAFYNKIIKFLFFPLIFLLFSFQIRT